MRKLVRLAMPLAALVPLTGCAPTGALIVASCEVGTYTPMRKGDVLTPETASDMEKNNESRKSAGCQPPQRVASKS